MNIENKIVHYDGSFPLSLSYIKLGKIENVWNQEVEVVFPIDGNINLYIKDKLYELKEGDAVVIGQNELHSIFGSGSYVSIKLNLFNFDRLPDNLKRSHFQSYIATTDDEKALFIPIKTLASQIITNEMTQSKNTVLLATGYAYEIIYALFNNLFFLIVNNETRFEEYNIISDMIEYMNFNYSDNNININSLSDHFNMAPSYLSRTFKTYMGVNPSSYLNKIRLDKAVSLLLDTDNSITDIASSCGFPSARAFSENFKDNFGEIPTVWKQKYHAVYKEYQKNSDYEFDTSNKYLTDNNLNRFIKTYQKANITFESTVSSYSLDTIEINKSELKYASPLSTCGHDIIGVAQARDLLRSEIQEELRIAQKEIGFKYIKTHSIFDDSMMVFSEKIPGHPKYNFILANTVYDFLLSINLTPIVELSFMPKDLARRPNKTTFHSSMITSLPKSYDRWKELITKFIDNLINRYGLNKVKDFKFKLWNEPASNESLFGIPVEDFIEFYEVTYKTVKEISPLLQFGGPGAFFTHSPEWIRTFFKATKERNIEPDFITVHYYDIVFNNNMNSENGHMKITELSKTTTSFSNYIDFVKKILREFNYDKKETFLTEWNNTTSHNDLLNDTCFKSSYVAKNLLENWDKFTHMGYWLLTDTNYEQFMDDHIFHGGLGLFAYYGIKKPVYNTFYLMNKLGNKLVKKGDNFFMTTNDSGDIIMLLFNYSHYSDIYASDIGINTSFDSRDKVFTDKKKISFQLKLPEKGHYRVALEFFNQKRGSSYDTFVAFGSGRNIDVEDVEYLKQQSVPHKKILYLNDEDSVEIFLEPFEVKLVSIRRVY